MNMKKIIPFFLSILMLSGAMILVADINRQQDSNQKASGSTKNEITTKQEEIRGVWISYMTLDVKKESDKEAAFKSKIKKIAADMKQANLNTAVVQVRPFCDALYPSRYFPWSHILTGTQGEDPGYDPLKEIINRFHKEDIRVEAWLNPYRIRTQSTPDTLCEDHPYVKDKELGVEINGCLYLNPASQKAIDLITNGVKELADNYDIDGIQFDDYFYPEDCGNFDQSDYEQYCSTTASPLSLEEYRIDNVNRMVRSVYQSIHQSGKQITFGISPQGNLQNNRNLSADVATWCAKEGYIDYICPQIYFSLDNPALTFEDGLQEWQSLKRHSDLKLYVGLAAYKGGTDADEGTWLDNDDIIRSEIEILQRAKADGFLLYSYDSFYDKKNKTEVQNALDYIRNSPTQ